MGDSKPIWLENLRHTSDYSHWSSEQFNSPVIVSASQQQDTSSVNTYTSDYGSYSSQESTHSGNTSIYSNLLDCEEVLTNLHIPYDPASPPAVPQNIPSSPHKTMDGKKKTRPLPPPRVDSKGYLLYKSQPGLNSSPPSKGTRASFDDYAIITNRKQSRDGFKKDEQSTPPSFATLPRKKKLATSTTDSTETTTHTSSSHVTWMKDIIQKETAAKASPTSNTRVKPIARPTPQPTVQGILKNKTMTSSSSAGRLEKSSAYINRNTVQRILDQQKKVSAMNRTHVITSTSQVYKSMPNLPPSTNQGRSPKSLISNSSRPTVSQRAWENNHQFERQQTARVLSVLEPGIPKFSSPESNHHRQNSAETEFEFPPPPSESDIAQILSPTVEFQAQPPPTTINITNLTSPQTRTRESRPLPPPPPRVKSSVSKLTSEKPQPPEKPAPTTNWSSPILQRSADSTDTVGDVVIPPPPGFQEEKDPQLPIQQQVHSYGDYEMLLASSMLQYERADTVPELSHKNGYHRMITSKTLPNTAISQPERRQFSNSRSYHNINKHGSQFPQQMNGSYLPHSPTSSHTAYQHRHNNNMPHYHQYSTEL